MLWDQIRLHRLPLLSSSGKRKNIRCMWPKNVVSCNCLKWKETGTAILDQQDQFSTQWCLPVGCVPPAGWPYLEEGVCLWGWGRSACTMALWEGRLPHVDRMTDTRLWKHYLPATSFAGAKNTQIHRFWWYFLKVKIEHTWSLCHLVSSFPWSLRNSQTEKGFLRVGLVFWRVTCQNSV